MERFILKYKRIPFWFELGLFNMTTLFLLLPLTWFQFFTNSCGGCGYGDSLRNFNQGNLLRVEIIGISLVATLLAEVAILWFSLDWDSPRGQMLLADYSLRVLLKCFPCLCLLLAAIALPEAKAFYAVLALIGLLTQFSKAYNKGTGPTALLTSSRNLPLRNHLKFLLVYLVLLIVGIPMFLVPGRAFTCSCEKLSSAKANMHTFQTMAETYAVNWQGTYPVNPSQIRAEALGPGQEYWKEFTNPFTSLSGEGKSYMPIPPDLKAAMSKPEVKEQLAHPYQDMLGIRIYHDVFVKSMNPKRAGMVLYDYIHPTRYYIYGLDKSGTLIREKGKPFTLTNG